MRERWHRLLHWLRSLGRKPLPEPEPRVCDWCGGPLPEEARPDQRYCSRTHQVKAKRRRAGRPVKPSGGTSSAIRARKRAAAVEDAWVLHSTPEAHAASCGSKRAYGSFGDALTALRWLRDESNHAGQARVYKCLACPKWHITSQAPVEERRRQAARNGTTLDPTVREMEAKEGQS